MTNWYREALRRAWDKPEFQHFVLDILERCRDAPGSAGGVHEDLLCAEDIAFGPRVECPHGCGSMNLPGAPRCFECEEPLEPSEKGEAP